VVIIRNLPEDRLLILGPLWSSVFLLSGFWFMLPIALPFMALALAASMQPAKGLGIATISNAITPERRKIRGIAIAIIILLTPACWIQYSSASSAATFMNAIQTRLPEPGDDAMLRDHGRGNTHLWWIAINLSQYINNKVTTNTPIKSDDVIWFKELLGMVGSTVETGTATNRLQGQYVSMHNDLIVQYQSPLWTDLRIDRLSHWKDVVSEAILKTPTRGDQSLLYYSFFMQRIKPTEKPEVNIGLTAQIMQMSDIVLKNNPDDQTSLWFSGLVMLRNPETSRLGLQRLTKAMSLKAERFVPVSEYVRTSLNAVIAEQIEREKH
jgi:hypothetical protein